MAAINRSEQYVTIYSQFRVTHVAVNVNMCAYSVSSWLHILLTGSDVLYICVSAEFFFLWNLYCRWSCSCKLADDTIEVSLDFVLVDRNSKTSIWLYVHSSDLFKIRFQREHAIYNLQNRVYHAFSQFIRSPFNGSNIYCNSLERVRSPWREPFTVVLLNSPL